MSGAFEGQYALHINNLTPRICLFCTREEEIGIAMGNTAMNWSFDGEWRDVSVLILTPGMMRGRDDSGAAIWQEE